MTTTIGTVAISPKLRWLREGYILEHWCPACQQPHPVHVASTGANGGGHWAWNEDAHLPTFHPSLSQTIRVWEGPQVGGKWKDTICHYFVKNGMIEFCADSQHALAGQTVPLPDIPVLED